MTKTHARDTYNYSHAYKTSHTSQNTKDNYSHAYKTSHTSQNTKDKNCSHQVSNIPCTKIYSREPFNNRQTLMVINTNPQDNKDLEQKQMQTINRTTQNWLKVETKESVHEEFPPYESIVVNHRNHQLIASPIKKVSLSDEAKNFEKIIEQNNYSNTYLKVIGAKLDRIENKIDPIKPTTKLDIEKPLFTPHEIPPKLRVSFKKDNTDLSEEISKKTPKFRYDKPSLIITK